MSFGGSTDHASYAPDGTGRDAYININNGGLGKKYKGVPKLGDVLRQYHQPVKDTPGVAFRKAQAKHPRNHKHRLALLSAPKYLKSAHGDSGMGARGDRASNYVPNPISNPLASFSNKARLSSSSSSPSSCYQPAAFANAGSYTSRSRFTDMFPSSRAGTCYGTFGAATFAAKRATHSRQQRHRYHHQQYVLRESLVAGGKRQYMAVLPRVMPNMPLTYR